MNNLLYKFLLNKTGLENKESILSDFEYLKNIMGNFLLEIKLVKKFSGKCKINLMESEKKTYELLGISNPKIKILWEGFKKDAYYRLIMLKDDNTNPRVLACSKTNITLIKSSLRDGMLNKKRPIGRVINDNSLDTIRIIYFIFNAKLKNKSSLNNIKKDIKQGRAYIIKNKRNDILFNIFEVFL